MLTVGSLFSGIGGIDLGLERAGMSVRWQVEIDPWCSRVLAKHWPDVERFADVREVGAHNLAPVDVIAGGFPCQDLSYAGKGAGITGARSGLWSEYARIIRELRPRYVLVENVPALLTRGLDVVLGDLAALGYDAEWDCVPASAVGAPHRRDRVWLVAYTEGDGCGSRRPRRPDSGSEGSQEPDESLADPARLRGRQPRVGALDGGTSGRGALGLGTVSPADETLADPEVVAQRSRLREGGEAGIWRGRPCDGCSSDLENAGCDTTGLERSTETTGCRPCSESRGPGWWATEPNVGRVAHGIPQRVDRLRGLGNAVVPQVVEAIGQRIVKAECQ